MTQRDKIVRRRVELLKQAVADKVTRREALKMGLATGTAGILAAGLPGEVAAQVVPPLVVSPPTTPWA